MSLDTRKKRAIIEYVKCQIENDHVHIHHYGSLKGINEFEQCDAVILLGTPFLPENEVKRMSHILGIDAQILMKSQIQGEMNQDWARIRPFNQTTPKTIIILSSYPIFKDSDPVNYVTESELLKKLGCLSIRELNLQKEIIEDILRYGNNKGKHEVVKSIHYRKTYIRAQIRYLDMQNIIEHKVRYIGKKEKKTSILSVSSKSYQILTTFHSSIRIRKIDNPLIQQTKFTESDLPEYPQSYFDEIYLNMICDRIPVLIGI